MRWKSISYGCPLVLSALALAACGDRGTDATASETGVTALYPGDERILGPYWEMPAKFLTFLPLVTWDSTGEVIPLLASRWDHDEEYRNWTVHLRPDVRWHDGTPFTAHDVAFTFHLFQHPDVLWMSPNRLSVEAVDDSTFRVSSLTSCGVDPLSPWTVYYPRHRLEDLDPADFITWDFWSSPIGNGPYRYVRHVPETMMELEANPEYFEGPPRIGRVTLKFGLSSVPELLSGNVDIAAWAEPAQALRLAAEPGFQSYWQYSAPRAILWKASHPLFEDPGVRRALTHAIDRETLHLVLNMPPGLPLFDVPLTDRQFRRGELPEPIGYNPDTARRLLAESGWDDADGDGVLEREGLPFEFELIVPGEVAGSGVFIQNQLRDVGIRVEVSTLGIGQVRRHWRSGDFEAIVAFVPEDRFLPMFGEESVSGYQNPQVVEILDALGCEADPAGRDSLYRELAPIFTRDQPATFLFRMLNWFVMDARIQGLSSPWQADPLANLHKLTIDPGPPDEAND